MKAFFTNRDFFKSSTFIKIAAFLFISLAFFYFGKHWSSDGYQQLIFFNSRQNPLPSFQTQTTPTVSLSPNHNKSFDISSLITNLVEDKGGQNWISIDKDKFKFPGGGTQFIHGADQYLDQISKMVPDTAFGQHTRVAMDVGCGVVSFGAYLLSRNVLTMSVAPKDVHENQVQFALERGVPAMMATLATRRLLEHILIMPLVILSCREDGILLLEVSRVLRAGGYFAWAAQPVCKDEPLIESNGKASLLSKLVKVDPSSKQLEQYINSSRQSKLCDAACRLWVVGTSRHLGAKPKEGYSTLFTAKAMLHITGMSFLSGVMRNESGIKERQGLVPRYVDLKACIIRLPDDVTRSNVTTWPARLLNPPDRLQSIQMDAYISRKELFRAESKYWSEIIASYVRVSHLKSYKLRNVLDMRAGFGGFATALIEHQLDCWVLNVVPVSGPNTLPVIYDRGLLGVLHDWCEPFDTYPRTYDLLHAAGLFSIERKRCNVSSIMLEMDRILRPSGRVYIRDSVGKFLTDIDMDVLEIVERKLFGIGQLCCCSGCDNFFNISTIMWLTRV
ncbi:hypothetical protein RHSIM_Rhsim03G0133700 [Rhododendron simsii]|uniref:Methyltransferase n=1 Tax=Rhododendron simsii TaxID=118357 RepID=A0A834H3M9_RHOSS|nr:hypothetical protein RHSIM_Rhsim03G0133700 [Rhododendron simsii]